MFCGFLVSQLKCENNACVSNIPVLNTGISVDIIFLEHCVHDWGKKNTFQDGAQKPFLKINFPSDQKFDNVSLSADVLLLIVGLVEVHLYLLTLNDSLWPTVYDEGEALNAGMRLTLVRQQ